MTFENEDDREKRLEKHIERVVRHAVANAIQPHVRTIQDVQNDAKRTAAAVKEDAERAKKVLADDQQRLAERVQEASEKQAKEIAKETVNALMKSLGLDPEKPGDFMRDMMFLRELRETFGTAKRHAITVLVGVVMMAMISGLWLGLKDHIGVGK